MAEANQTYPKKYLFFKLGALGDISFFLPAVDQVKAIDPRAQVTWIAGAAYAEFLKANPKIDRVIRVDEGKLFGSSGLNRLLEIWRLWIQLDFFYDQVWIGYRGLSAFFLMRLRVIGRVFQLVRRPSRFFRFFRNECVVPPLSLHESLGFKSLAEKALQVQIQNKNWVSDFSWIPKCELPVQRPFVVVHMGGGSNAKTEFKLKKWPHWESFLSEWLKAVKCPIVLVGAPQEKSETDQILRSHSEWNGRVISKVGDTRILDLVAILKEAQLCVGTDSGPLHFADALGIPCVGLYGPTSSVSWGLLGKKTQIIRHLVPCSPCYQDDGHFPDCPYDVRCMKNLEPKQVLEAVK